MLVAVFMCNPRCNALAQDWAKERLNKSPRHGEWVDLKSGERTIKAFVVYPERKEKTPVVIVIQEIFGLTDWVRGICDQLAENGVIAIAPDLLSGQTYSDADGARKAISALTKEQIKSDLDAVWMAKLCNRLDHVSAVSKELEVFVLLLHRRIAELLVVKLCRARSGNFEVRFG